MGSYYFLSQRKLIFWKIIVVNKVFEGNFLTHLMKTVVCGDENVGKDEFFDVYCGEKFQSKYMMTIGAKFRLKEARVDGKAIKFQIWNLATRQRFGAVRSVYYLGALGAILVFDVNQRESFDNLKLWIKEIFNHNGKGPIPLIIIGNRIELRINSSDHIADEIVQEYCKKLTEQVNQKSFEVKYCPFMTNGDNPERIFDELARFYFSSLDKRNDLEKANKFVGKSF